MSSLNPNILSNPVVLAYPEPSFDELPRELHEMIMEGTNDLATICSILYASPQASRVFNACPVQITNTGLRPGLGSQIDDMIRIWIAIRLGEIDSANISEFYRDYISRIGQPGLKNMFDKLYSSDRNMCREIVVTAYRVWWHTQCCLKFYMDRFRELRPLYPSNPSFRYRGSPTVPWRRRPQTQEMYRFHAGPPSAREELTVARALWRIQIEYALQNAYMANNAYEWPAEDEGKLFPLDRGWIWDDSDDDEFKCIMATVDEYVRVVRVRRDLRVIPDDDTFTTRRLPKAQVSLPFTWDNADIEGEDVQCTSDSIRAHPHPAMKFWNYLTEDHCSPLQNVRFEEFIEFGFSIWDLQRFCASWLLTPDDAIWDPTNTDARSRLYFAWRSILSRDVLKEYDRRSNVRSTWP